MMEWILVAFLGGLAGAYYYRRHSLLVPVKIEKDADAIFQTWTDIPFSLTQPGQDGHWNRAVLVLSANEIRLQTKQEKAVRFNSMMDELRGYWLVDDEIWLHAHISTSWYILRMRLMESSQFLDYLDDYTSQGIDTELPPTLAEYDSKQVSLYLAPHSLVISTGNIVLNVIPLNTIHNITTSENTLEFDSDKQSWIFTMPDADSWYHALKQAIKD